MSKDREIPMRDDMKYSANLAENDETLSWNTLLLDQALEILRTTQDPVTALKEVWQAIEPGLREKTSKRFYQLPEGEAQEIKFALNKITSAILEKFWAKAATQPDIQNNATAAREFTENMLEKYSFMIGPVQNY